MQHVGLCVWSDGRTEKKSRLGPPSFPIGKVNANGNAGLGKMHLPTMTIILYKNKRRA